MSQIKHVLFEQDELKTVQQLLEEARAQRDANKLAAEGAEKDAAAARDALVRKAEELNLALRSLESVSEDLKASSEAIERLQADREAAESKVTTQALSSLLSPKQELDRKVMGPYV